MTENKKISTGEIINIANIIVTLILSVCTLWISYNTYLASERINTLARKQSDFELSTSIYTLINTISLIKQTEGEKPDVKRCIRAYSEMRIVLESQIKNISLIQREELANQWQELIVELNFQIKFLEEGLKPNTVVDGVPEELNKVDSMIKKIADTYNRLL